MSYPAPPTCEPVSADTVATLWETTDSDGDSAGLLAFSFVPDQVLLVTGTAGVRLDKKTAATLRDTLDRWLKKQ